jgi:hypothetical protein
MSRKSRVVFGLGVFFLVIAAALQFYAVPNLVKIPLSQNKTSVSEATDVTYLDYSVLEIKTAQNLRATRKIRSDVRASSDDHVVFDEFLTVENADTGKLVSATTDRVALDRHDAHAVNCCNEAVESKPTEHTGLTYTFPLGTEKKTYQYFDTTALKAFPMEFQGTENLGGLTVYRFRQTVPEQVLSQKGVPGSLIGRSEPLLTADQVYSNTRTVWVEPTSGMIVKGQEEQLQVLRADGGPDTTVLKAKVAFTEDNVAAGVKEAKSKRSEITLISKTLPTAALAVGILLVLVGIVLLLVGRRGSSAGRRRADGAAHAEDAEPSRV